MHTTKNIGSAKKFGRVFPSELFGQPSIFKKMVSTHFTLKKFLPLSTENSYQPSHKVNP